MNSKLHGMVEPVLRHWEQEGNEPLPYASGTWGPAAASALIGRDGLQWREEALRDKRTNTENHMLLETFVMSFHFAEKAFTPEMFPYKKN